jgi:SAM-dependent methyltransferase
MPCPVCASNEQTLSGSKDGYDLYRCGTCQLLYVFPMPSDETLGAFYDGYHKTRQYRAKLASKVRRAKNRIGRLRSKVRGRDFLDVGCNAGFAVEAARKLGFVALGIDIDAATTAEAGKLFPECQFSTISVQDLAATGKQFDLIYCSEVIEHLTVLDDFLVAVAKLMKPDSVLYMTTPDIGHFTLNKPFRQEPLISWDGIRPPEHLFYFAKGNMKRLLDKRGFTRVKFQWSLQPTLKMVVRR